MSATPISSPPLTEQEWEHVSEAVRLHASRFHANVDDMEDWEIEYPTWLSSCIQEGRSGLRALLTNDALLYRCTANWIRDKIRHQSMEQSHRAGSRWQDEADGDLSELPDVAPSPLARILGMELQERLEGIRHKFKGRKREIFDRRFILFQSPQEIAEATGRTRHAIDQATSELRAQVRRQLALVDLDEAEVSDYLLLINQL